MVSCCRYCFCRNLLNFLSSFTLVLTFSTKPKRLLIFHVTIILCVVVDILYIYGNFVIKTVDPEFFRNCLTMISVTLVVWEHSGTVFAGHSGTCATLCHTVVFHNTPWDSGSLLLHICLAAILAAICCRFVY